MYFILKIANVNDIVLLISNSTCSLLVYRKEIDFCVSTLYIAILLKLHLFFFPNVQISTKEHRYTKKLGKCPNQINKINVQKLTIRKQIYEYFTVNSIKYLKCVQYVK